jgi:hypothetical protein
MPYPWQSGFRIEAWLSTSTGGFFMRIIVAAAALSLLASTTAYAANEALTEEQVEGVQTAIKAMGCTVEDDNIEIEGSGYEADDVICKDGQYDIYLNKDFTVKNKIKED